MKTFIVVDRFGIFCNFAVYLTRRLKCFFVGLNAKQFVGQIQGKKKLVQGKACFLPESVEFLKAPGIQCDCLTVNPGIVTLVSESCYWGLE